MGKSNISVDINNRTFDIEVPDENVASVLKLIGDIFEQLPPVKPVQSKPDSTDKDENISNSNEENSLEEQSKPKKKRSGGKGPAKVRAPELIDLGLTQDQRIEMQKFFTEKEPSGQNDQVAVLAFKLKEFKKVAEFSVDEIHSAFKVVNKPTPKNLIAVFGNMKRDGKGGYSDNKLVVNSFLEDHVNFHMIKSDKK